MSLRDVFKFIVPVLLVLLLAGAAQAAPFLVCNAEPNVNSCVVEVDGIEFPTPYPLHHDVAGVTTGGHTVRVKFVNDLWGDTEWSDPLDFTRPSLGVASGITLSVD